MKTVKIIWNSRYTKSILIHTCCWLVYIFYELGSIYLINGKLESLGVYFIYYSLNISFFYGHLCLLNFSFDRRAPRYFKGILLYLILIAFYFIAKVNVSYLLQTTHLTYLAYFYSFNAFITTTLVRIAYFALLSTFYWATSNISNYRKQVAASEKQELLALKQKAELETRLVESRNAYLKQQINPHLLFNSLNFIYNSVYRHSPEGGECVILLSDMMRFSLEESGPDGKVSLPDEVAQLHRLLAINRFRFDKQLAVDINFEGIFDSYRIIPLILFTLMENVFKHGNLLDSSRPATLSLIVTEHGRLYFHSRNLKKSKSDYAVRTQIGLQNVRVRLDFAYPGRYSLLIDESEDYYELNLNLSL